MSDCIFQRNLKPFLDGRFIPTFTLCFAALCELAILPPLRFSIPYCFVLALFYWTIYRPWSVHPSLLLLVGITYDILLNTPLGSTALSYLLLYGFIFFQRSSMPHATFFTVWFAFSLTALLIAIWKIIFSPFVDLTLIGDRFFEATLTIFLFPLATRFLSGLISSRGVNHE